MASKEAINSPLNRSSGLGSVSMICWYRTNNQSRKMRSTSSTISSLEEKW